MSENTTSHFELWLDGRPQPSTTGERFERHSPYDDTLSSTFANGDGTDAARAIVSTRRAFDHGPWSHSTARERHDVLTRAAQILGERADALADRMVLESGKPINLARGEVLGAIKTFEYYAGLALASEGEAISERTPGAIGMVLREPVGVAAFITAWNFPLLGVACKLAPAIAAGCVVIAKPSHMCSGPAMLLAQIMTDAGLPDGAFNVVTSDRERGALVGQHLSASTAVDKVAFTGSTASGQAVMRAAASNTKRVALELGGKSANIVFADAPFDDAVTTALGAFTFNSGQQCSAGSRLLLQRDIYDDFLHALTEKAAQVVLGDPRSTATTMGPLVSSDQQRRVLEYVEIGTQEAKLVAGGGPGIHETGYFVEPTIFADVDNNSRIAQEEVFGPVLSVIPFTSAQDAIAIANDSRYGLAGGVWTGSLDTAFQVVRGVRTGKMFVNCYNTSGLDDMPHGGYKESGVGREFGRSGLEEFLEQKTVQIRLS